MHLSGTGDVVITDLRSTESTLVLPAALRGRVTIVDKDGRVAIELVKEAGDPLSLALPNQTYSVHVDNKDGEFVATVTLDHDGVIDFQEGTLHRVSPEQTVARGVGHTTKGDDDDDDDDKDRGPWFRRIPIDFGGGLRVERPNAPANFDALLTLGGTSREVHGNPVVGIAETGVGAQRLEVGRRVLGEHLGDLVGERAEQLVLRHEIRLAIDLEQHAHAGSGEDGRRDDALVGATIGFGLSGITGGILEVGWKMPTEFFAVLEISPELRPMAYFRQTYVFGSELRQNGSKMARWGDEAEAGAGLRFGGKLEGFFYGSVREMENVRYWGIGVGAIL